MEKGSRHIEPRRPITSNGVDICEVARPIRFSSSILTRPDDGHQFISRAAHFKRSPRDLSIELDGRNVETKRPGERPLPPLPGTVQ